MNPLAIVQGMISLGDKFIEDKDKRAEFAYKTLEMLLTTVTWKWVDALVKLSYASEQITKGLLRPIGSAFLTGFTIYCAYKGIPLSGPVETVGIAAFPSWMASRHLDKAEGRKITTKRKMTKEEDEEIFGGDV